MRVVPDFKDGQPYFVAKDVAEALGFKNTSKAINDHCKGNDSLSIGRGSAARLINEGDLYRLVMRSNLPSAQAFQDWVCGTVLPAIRKDGAYIMGEEKGINGK
ncbi:BRO-N domain-containing protein [Shewanella algae]|uniref:BRO-N domain-containing protein n=1 Tax=Shewanella algae TaxID=38313 RepID=UPI003735671C